MDRKELIRQYKAQAPTMGIWVIKNNINGKVLLGSSKNTKNVFYSHLGQLRAGLFMISELQKDWNSLGEGAFTLEVVETVKIKDDPNFNQLAELEILEEIWIDKLQPFGENGYNKNGKLIKN